MIGIMEMRGGSRAPVGIQGGALLCAQDGLMGMRYIQRGRHEWHPWLVVGAVREPPEMDLGGCGVSRGATFMAPDMGFRGY